MAQPRKDAGAAKGGGAPPPLSRAIQQRIPSARSGACRELGMAKSVIVDSSSSQQQTNGPFRRPQQGPPSSMNRRRQRGADADGPPLSSTVRTGTAFSSPSGSLSVSDFVGNAQTTLSPHSPNASMMPGTGARRPSDTNHSRSLPLQNANSPLALSRKVGGGAPLLYTNASSASQSSTAAANNNAEPIYMKNVNLTNVNGIDVTYLSGMLCAEEETSDESIPWNWDYLYASLVDELREEWLAESGAANSAVANTPLVQS